MSNVKWIGGAVTFALAVGLAAMAFFSAIFTGARIAGPLPAWVVIAVGALAIPALAFGYSPTGSRWRVPAAWQRAGHLGFAGLFGFSLGLGVVTSLPSVGLVVLAALAADADDFRLIVTIGLGFAFGRVTPFLWVVVRTNTRERHRRFIHDVLVQVEQLATLARPLEVSILAGLMCLLLVRGR